MKTAFVIYDGITALDFIGVYDSLSRIKSMGFDKDFLIDICGLEHTIKDSTGKIAFNIEKIGCSLKTYDNARLVSVCSGALLYGKAGFLHDKNITTHKNLFSCMTDYGCKIINKRVVADGNIITAGGVTAGIDLGLYLCGILYNKDIMYKIATQMEYQLPEDFETELF